MPSAPGVSSIGSDGILKKSSRGSLTRKASTSNSLSSSIPLGQRVKFKLEDARQLAACTKLIAGIAGEITYEELEELFNCLGSTEEGMLSFTELSLLLSKDAGVDNDAMEELEAMFSISEEGMVSLSTVFSCLQSGQVGSVLSKMEERTTKNTEISLQHKEDLTFDFLKKKVAWRVDRDDSFTTLPLTLSYTIVFILVVSYHLDIHARERIDVGLRSWVEGYGQSLNGPFIMQHVADASTFWDWMTASGVDAVFCGTRQLSGRCNYKYSANTEASPQILLANSQVLIGDARLMRKQLNSWEGPNWLLHSSVASTHLDQHKHDYVGAAKKTIAHLKTSEWIGYDTQEVTLEFCTYSETANMFAFTTVKIRFDDLGYVALLVAVQAIPIMAYGDPFMWVIDALYMLLLLYKFSHEAVDLCGAVRHGFNTFKRYWNYRNFVDWVTVGTGLLNIIAWVTCCLAMQGPTVNSLLGSGSGKLVLRPLDLNIKDLSSIMDELSHIYACFYMLHLSFAISTLALLALFFKAFEANLRLQVVPDTLENTRVDIVHFFVVFITLFMSFATIGHILFGCDIVEFATLASGVYTCFFILVGVFDWYADLVDVARPLPSRMPLPLLQIWFTVFLLLMTLLLLNMLLAVILIQYSTVKEQAAITDNNPIWTQARNFFKRKLETHGHPMSLQRIQRILERRSRDIGTGVVTKASLMEAFPTMSDAQALWLEDTFSKVLHKEKSHLQDQEDKNNRHVHNECLLRSVAQKVHALSALTERNMMKVVGAQNYLDEVLADVSKEGTRQEIMTPYKMKDLPAVQYSFDR